MSLPSWTRKLGRAGHLVRTAFLRAGWHSLTVGSPGCRIQTTSHPELTVPGLPASITTAPREDCQPLPLQRNELWIRGSEAVRLPRARLQAQVCLNPNAALWTMVEQRRTSDAGP